MADLTSKKRMLCAVGLLVVVALLATGKRLTSTVTAPEHVAAPRLPARSPLDMLQGETKRRVAHVETTLAPRPPVTLVVAPTAPAAPDGNDRALLATATALAPTFCALYGQHDYFDRDAICAEIFDQLAEDPDNVAAASRVLTDPDFLRRAIVPEQQAVARVYAIHFLRHQAAHGDMAPLISTTRALFSSVASHGEQIRGQVRDVEALLRAVLKHQYEPVEVCERPAELVREILLADGQDNAGLDDPALTEAVEAAFWLAAYGYDSSRPTLARVGREVKEVLRGVGSRGG